MKNIPLSVIAQIACFLIVVIVVTTDYLHPYLVFFFTIMYIVFASVELVYRYGKESTSND